MGIVKDKINNNKSKFHDLTDFEIAYLQQVNVIRDALVRLQSSFLSYIAGSRLGYKKGESLQFEIDFSKKIVKVTKVKNTDITEN